MNSIWNKNISLFIDRFASLADLFGISKASEDLPQELKAPVEIIESRQGNKTAKDNGKLLHSMYNPIREAEQAAESAKNNPAKKIHTCAFFGCGLGYTAIAYAQKFKEDTLIIIEPDPRYFFTALATTDWTPVLTAKNCIIALATGADIAVSLIEQCGGIEQCAVIAQPTHIQHALPYFTALNSQIERNSRKNTINIATWGRFSPLWKRNTIKNLLALAQKDGVNRYKGKCPKDLPFVILAAGPSLANLLPHLAEIKKRSIVVAVDTSLRACLRAGVEPDFIVLGDPQYYAYRHIAGLSSPSSVLITDATTYPPALRFKCKEIILFSSFFPLAKYFESKLGIKGELTSGGSVSTTAWDFAKLAGASRIYCGGLDLGFPSLETHIRGSTFEEQIHTTSTRAKTAETAGVSALFGANMQWDTDYAGNKILTDNRMKMFAWWFESQTTENQQTESFSFSASSLKIPGFKTESIESFLAQPEKQADRIQFLSSFEKSEAFTSKEQQMQKIINDFYMQISKIEEYVKHSLRMADTGIEESLKRKSILQTLTKNDDTIFAQFSELKDILLPPKPVLNKKQASLELSTVPDVAALQQKKFIYKEILSNIRELKEI